MAITKEEIIKLADLARIEIPEKEVESLAHEMDSILDYVKIIQNFNSDEKNKKVLYTLRATRLWLWEKEFNFPQTIIDDLAGNSFATRKDHYRPKPTAKDLSEMLIRHSKIKKIS